jgi:DNA ligase-1
MSLLTTFDRLPSTLMLPKPMDLESSLPPAQYAFQRKYDGLRHLLVRGETRADIYSRKIERVTDSFPDLAAAMLAWPVGTILDTEFIVWNGERDDFEAAQSIARSHGKTSQYRQVGKRMAFMAFDLLFLSGLPAWQVPYGERQALLREVLSSWPIPVVQQAPHLEGTFDQLQARAIAEQWEGLVAWQTDKPTLLTCSSKTVRANCYRWKPWLEADLVATGWTPMDGNAAMMGALTLQDGTGRDVGRVGSGFRDAERKSAPRWQFPCVVTVRYDRLTENAMRFPRFIRLRNDKSVNEATCLE